MKKIIIIALLAITGIVVAQTQEEWELYRIAKNASDPEYCFSLVNPDYQMYCRVKVRDVGASCSEIESPRIREACERLSK